MIDPPSRQASFRYIGFILLVMIALGLALAVLFYGVLL